MNDEFFGKRLMEVLSEMDDETLIYLGAQSSFFDIATAGEMKQPGYIKRLSNELHDAAEENFVPLQMRSVKAVYPRIDGTGICVIIFGNEMGRYWFLSEKKCGKSAAVQHES